MNFGPEWLIPLGIIVLLFGAKKLPELARSLGKSQSEFKKGMKDGVSAPAEDEAKAEGTRTEATAEAKSEEPAADKPAE